MIRRTIAASMLIAICLSALAGTIVLAKGGVATLDAQLPSDPEVGSELTVGWTVATPLEDGSSAPFSASGMFIRLIPATGEPVEAIGSQDRAGHYTATIVVPEGGIAEVEFGLRGESCMDGICERSDLMFAVDDAPADAAPADAAPAVLASPAAQEPVTSQPTGETAPSPALDLAVLLVILGGVAILAGIGATMARGRRLEPGSTR